MKIGKELSSKPQHKNVVAHESWVKMGWNHEKTVKL